MTDAPDGREPSPAELFEEFFGPSIFTPWTQVLLDYARPRLGERVLDLACATGIVARQVSPTVGRGGEVVGVDVSPDMLEVARERAISEGVSVEWREEDASDLELPDDTFDLVLCQQGLQFFDDPAAALQETERVLVDGGRVALNVWQPLEHHPVYEPLLEAEARHLEVDLADVATPFVFGDDERLYTLLREAGFDRIQIAERTLDVRFDDPETFVALTVMAGAAVVPEMATDNAEERAALIEAVADDCEKVLAEHRNGDSLRFPTPNYVATAHA